MGAFRAVGLGLMRILLLYVGYTTKKRQIFVEQNCTEIVRNAEPDPVGVPLGKAKRLRDAFQMELGAPLRTQVEHFKGWAASHSKGRKLDRDWETEYPQWDALYGAAIDLLQSNPSEWDLELENLLLYAIARDNEAGLIAGSLSQCQVDALASQLLLSSEPDAKGQFPELLGKCPLSIERGTFLFALAEDTNENVRTRAINVLTALSLRLAC